MYDELVKRLRTECTLPFQTLQLMREAADAIEELICEVADEHNARLDAEERQRWIPVTERLPEPETDVLSFRIYGSFSQMSEVTINDMKKNGEWCYEGVTHWMSLPQPPKEE